MSTTSFPWPGHASPSERCRTTRPPSHRDAQTHAAGYRPEDRCRLASQWARLTDLRPREFPWPHQTTGAHARLDQRRGIQARDGTERSSLRSPDPRRVERRATRRPRGFEIRTGLNIRPTVRAHRGQRQPDIHRELRLASQARASHGLPPLRKDGGQMRPQQTKPRHISPAQRTMGYRPAVQRPSTTTEHRKRPGSGTKRKPAPAPKGSKNTLNARDGTSIPHRVPRRDASFENQPIPPIPASEQADAIKPRRTPSGTHTKDAKEIDNKLRGIARRTCTASARRAAPLVAVSPPWRHWAAPPHAHEFDEALIIRATVSLTGYRQPVTCIESLLHTEAPEAQYNTWITAVSRFRPDGTPNPGNDPS